ncbi:hypothetical protein J4H86_14855 [Spiractinospora alimapuensis]|uniref:hypothetical protein n=1 Tax=Spiractinospora alimapuensis TaxID=2820884 RepID=UPI001F40F74F|nr:hypothetical protein [Spiractinospora alimapuensis]QVQ50229.1 hypothetical protein J4H86_14855 [Spiractinospora alimapuensis]
MRHVKRSDAPRTTGHTAEATSERTSRLDPRVVLLGGDPGMRLVVGTLVPDLHSSVAGPDATVWLLDGRGSQAVVGPDPSGAGVVVRHGGPRDLWAEVEAAVAAWTGVGRPGPSRLGVTVGTDGRHDLWVDRPDNVLAP